MRCSSQIALVAVVLLTFPIMAQAKQATVEEAASQADEVAIQKAIDSYVAAFNRGDAKALAGHWSAEGELQTPAGNVIQGQKALSEDFAAYFQETKNVKLELLDVSITLLSPHVAQETGVARVIVPEEEPKETDYVAIHVKGKEGWKIDRISEQDPPLPPPTHYEQLQALEWMVGTWKDESEGSSIETTCDWTKNRNFLIRSFKVYIEDRADLEGTQVIGWDPHMGTIRSWLFDSDGGFGVGRWTGAENQWTVNSLHVLPDGRRASATNIHELIDENTLRFQSIGRTVDGELMPSIDPVEVRRVQ